MTNIAIIRKLRREAQTLVQRGGNLYRVRAYRQAAFVLTAMPGEVATLGPESLREAGLGKKLAETVCEWAQDSVPQETYPVPS